MFKQKDDTQNLYRDKIGVSMGQEKKLTKNLFRVGAVAVYLEKKIPNFIKTMELDSSEVNTLKSAMMVAKKYKSTLQALLNDIERDGLTPEYMSELVNYVKKGIKFIEKAKRKIGAERFNKLTLNILGDQRKSKLADKAGFSYQRINKLVHSEDYKKKRSGLTPPKASPQITAKQEQPRQKERLSEPLDIYTLQRGNTKEVSFRIPTTTKIVPIKELPKYVDRLTPKELAELKQAYYLLA